MRNRRDRIVNINSWHARRQRERDRRRAAIFLCSLLIGSALLALLRLCLHGRVLP